MKIREKIRMEICVGPLSTVEERLIRLFEREAIKFPDTPSFIAGLGTGAGSTAWIAGHTDWWIWTAIAVSAAVSAAVTHAWRLRK